MSNSLIEFVNRLYPLFSSSTFKISFDLPISLYHVGFFDIAYNNYTIAGMWFPLENYFGITSVEHAAYGASADEVYNSIDLLIARILHLFIFNEQTIKGKIVIT